ncbi:hypothetical protein B9T33_00335 [Acinetobacter sp. ANC 5054]|uniref:DUF2628 domain-containing protein n=1 Tax=Acinetobacter sp. ANC 5054 TaxID=1977877 RepID=UPI000A35B8FA|nr:DUF2628 domain-containing protein [Acinetobacter sp. ANC 5054]OTG84286.1 hypothetical protein B9T33_00335 [Acinetobacter sp. ANC 5054]
MQTESNFKDLLKIFVGPRAQSYLDHIEGKNQNSTFAQLSWAGLIFGPLWLLYRKMYSYFFLFLVIGGVIGLLCEIVGVPTQVLIGLSCISNLILVFIGKRLYSQFAVQKTKAYIHNPKYSKKVFAEVGGVSLSVPLLVLFIQLVVVIMMSLPFIPFSPF